MIDGKNAPKIVGHAGLTPWFLGKYHRIFIYQVIPNKVVQTTASHIRDIATSHRCDPGIPRKINQDIPSLRCYKCYRSICSSVAWLIYTHSHNLYQDQRLTQTLKILLFRQANICVHLADEKMAHDTMRHFKMIKTKNYSDSRWTSTETDPMSLSEAFLSRCSSTASICSAPSSLC